MIFDIVIQINCIIKKIVFVVLLIDFRIRFRCTFCSWLVVRFVRDLIIFCQCRCLIIDTWNLLTKFISLIVSNLELCTFNSIAIFFAHWLANLIYFWKISTKFWAMIFSLNLLRAYLTDFLRIQLVKFSVFFRDFSFFHFNHYYFIKFTCICV